MDTHLDDEREERDDEESLERDAAIDLATSGEVESEEEEELESQDEEEGEAGDDDGEEGGEAGATPPAVSRKVRRRSRRTRPRSRTIAMKRLTREELRLGALLNPPVDIPRPNTRQQCENDIRPCPWVACKHHLYLDVNPETGSIKINFPDLEPWEMRETCALDVADRAGITLEEVGEIMNLTRERIRQVEVRGLLKLKMASPLEGFSVGDGDLERGFGDGD
ncbi:MAG TPA: sigma factor-like helix-turn-helix DNA-binding protein [Kofleriaceae bacterium]|nr:sigma factor-like helix-turn-helix DNA-binding protein [Kofleriaceae bacterium]